MPEKSAVVSTDELDPLELEFTPGFYLCCRLTVSPEFSSKQFKSGLLESMRCCRTASGFLSELLAIKGLDNVAFRYGKVVIRYLAGEDLERIRREITETIKRHPNRNFA